MKAQVIFNPVSGLRDPSRDLQQAIAHLASSGWDISLKQTLGRGDATTYAREAVAEGCDAVLVASGDGTLGEAAAGLVGTDVTLGTLPVGVTNVWARQLGMPVWSPISRHSLVEAAVALSRSHVRRIDVGCVGDRCFLLYAGIGFDARVTERVEPHLPIKRHLGQAAYAIAGVVEAMNFVGTRAHIRLDDTVLRARLLVILVSNAQLYGGISRVAPEAQLDDGRLDVCVFRGQGTVSLLQHVFRVFTERHMRSPKMRYYRARRVEVRTARPLPLQVDGDPIGHTPATIEILPRALNIFVPPSAPKGLFVDEQE